MSKRIPVALSLPQLDYLLELIDHDLETQTDLDADAVVTAQAARGRIVRGIQRAERAFAQP